MARRLTTFSKLLITALIVALLFFGGKYVLNNTSFGQQLKESGQEKMEQSNNTSNNNKDNTSNAGAKNNNSNSGSKSNQTRNNGSDDDVLKVQLVTWGGYAPGLYFNEGAKPNQNSRFFKEYGLNVEFVRNDDLIAAQNAWIAGEYDIIVQTADAFPLYTSAAELQQYKPKAIMQVDWSRGGDVMIAKRGINSINDLKGKRVALAEPSPSQTLLISALEAAGLSYDDIKVVATQDPIMAAQAFKGPDVDAAVVWSPFDMEALAEVPGSSALLTTADQSHIIADIMFAKDEFIQNNPDKIKAFYEGWMKATAELSASKSNYEKAGKILGEFLEFPVEDALGAMSVVRFASHGDNMDFFGLNRDYKGMKGSDLYTKMSSKFYELKQAESIAPAWRNAAYTGAVIAADRNLKGAAYASEGAKKFTPASPKVKKAAPIAAKSVSISFPTGQFAIGENAKTIIDLQFSEVAKTFGNTRIRVEGNTDNVGARQMNIDLSKKRAQSVANYLINQYGIDANRLIIVGNGPDKPVKGCETNASDACKAKNRRTEFQLVADQ